jgi:hypothetical protein
VTNVVVGLQLLHLLEAHKRSLKLASAVVGLPQQPVGMCIPREFLKSTVAKAYEFVVLALIE